MSFEKNVLSASLAGGKGLAAQAFAVVVVDAFEDPRHSLIAEKIVRLLEKGSAIDYPSLKAELGESIVQAGGELYLKELKLHQANPRNISKYARDVMDNFMVRKARLGLADLMGKDGLTPSEFLRELDQVYLGFEDKSRDNSFSAAAAITQLLEKAKERYEAKGELLGDPLFGIPSLDKLIDGVSEGNVILIAGRPKTGKSSLFNSIVEYHARERIGLSLISGEMPLASTTARMAAAATGFPYRYVRSGAFYEKPEDVAKLEKYKTDSIGNNVFLAKDQLSIPNMNYHVRKMFHEHGITRFCFDRVGRFKEVGEARVDHVARSRVIDAMRDLANDLGIVVVTASQIKADADVTKDKRPMPYHIYGGTHMIGNCTATLIIYNPFAKGLETFAGGPHFGAPAKGFMEVYVGDANDLEGGSVRLRFLGDRMFVTENENWFTDGEEYNEATVDEVIENDDELPF